MLEVVLVQEFSVAVYIMNIKACHDLFSSRASDPAAAVSLRHFRGNCL